ncbi:hypothetical protein EYF80_055586 [Liparis tanakae]|uniref:Uncharacterized protein n=1 Tax=Liparis tanakae TaxID=230148 RepID=A0A4Z2EZN8_9TELE|nr:hypothetical protein EYF80_055586 [Liparis tanakae]
MPLLHLHQLRGHVSSRTAAAASSSPPPPAHRAASVVGSGIFFISSLELPTSNPPDHRTTGPRLSSAPQALTL